MNSSKFRLTLDLHSIQSQYSIPVMVGDTSVTLLINITDGGVPYIIEDGCYARISIKRPNKTEIEDVCAIRNNTVIEYHFAEDGTTCAMEGIHHCDITLFDGKGERVGSPWFTMIVSEKVIRSDDLENIPPVDQTLLDSYAAEEARRREAEELRVEAETERATAEEERIAAESERAERFESVKVDADRAEAAAERVEGYEGKILNNEKRITNLEKSYYQEDDFITSTMVSYQRIVPENVLPCAEVESVADEVTAIKSLSGNLVLSDEAIFYSNLAGNCMQVTPLGSGKFMFNGYTSWGDGYQDRYTFLSIPVKTGVYKVARTFISETNNDCSAFAMDIAVNGVVSDFDSYITVPKDTNMDFRVFVHTGGTGLVDTVYSFEMYKYDGFENEVENYSEFISKPVNSLKITDLGNSTFRFDGYTEFQNRMTYTFLKVPLPKGTYSFSASVVDEGIIEENMVTVTEFKIKVNRNEVSSSDSITVTEATTAEIRVDIATSGNGVDGLIVRFSLANEGNISKALIDILETPLGEENFIKVEPKGTLIFENEGKQKVSNTITYMRKGE